jgi:hypothetical protein
MSRFNGLYTLLAIRYLTYSLRVRFYSNCILNLLFKIQFFQKSTYLFQKDESFLT